MDLGLAGTALRSVRPTRPIGLLHLHLDPAGFGLLLLRHRDGQHAVLELRLNLVGIHVLRKRHQAAEAAESPLSPMPRGLLDLRGLSFAFDAELVVAVDEDDATVEIQQFDGTIGEYEIERWPELMLTEISAPEDWSGSVDMDPEDFSSKKDVDLPNGYHDPLAFLDKL